jgi:RimJ/RimL family protein N-acetyltransferase
MKIVPASNDLAPSFWSALDQVANERKYLLMLEAPPKESLVSFVSDIVKNDWTQFYAVENDHVVGWCDIVPQQREGIKHVGAVGMGVLPDYRKRGIGKKLLIECINDAFGKGIERIELEVFVSNTGAVKLYENLGFEKEGVKRKARYIDEEYDDILVMSLLKSEQNKACEMNAEIAPLSQHPST